MHDFKDIHEESIICLVHIVITVGFSEHDIVQSRNMIVLNVTRIKGNINTHMTRHK